MAGVMALKKTSSLMNLGGSIDLVDGAGYSQAEIGLPLNALERQVWVVTDVQIDCELLNFDAALGGEKQIVGGVYRTSQTANLGIDDPDAIATLAYNTIQGGAANLGTGAAQMTRFPDETSSGTSRDYLCIISTPDFFVGGAYATTTGGAPNRALHVRITGYQATADVGTYSALIAEEINS